MSAILFDFNGTMIFDSPIVEKTWIRFLGNYGIDATIEQVHSFALGIPSSDSIDHFFPNVSKVKNAQLVDEVEQTYMDSCVECAGGLYKLADGLQDFLDECKTKGIKMTIATSAPQKNVMFFFETLDLDRWFEYENVVFCDGSYPGKPDPTIYLKAAAKLNTPIEDCVIFEDSSNGIVAATRSNCKAVIGLTSSLDEKNVYDLGANYAIKDYKNKKELLRIIEN